jgi:hypothetical protein
MRAAGHAFGRRFALSFGPDAHRVAQVKATTIAGLVTPHLFRVVDLAKQAETGANIDWHLRDAVTRTIDALAHQYNARDLLFTYVQGLESAAGEAGRGRGMYASALRQAAAQAARHLEKM